MVEPLLTNNVFVAATITSAVQQKAVLLTVAGEEVNNMVESLPEDQLLPHE